MHPPLPAKVDIAIIGAGIIGVMTALELAERGLSVGLFEKGQIAGEQSGRNWGWVRKMGRDPREIPLMIQSIALWRGMNERLGRETGFRQCGIAYLAQNAKQMAGHESWLKSAGDHPVGSRLITGAEVASPSQVPSTHRMTPAPNHRSPLPPWQLRQLKRVCRFLPNAPCADLKRKQAA